MYVRDIVTKLKVLEVTMFDSLLIHCIFYILPYHYTPFKIAYNT